jgi:hypothetical protein
MAGHRLIGAVPYEEPQSRTTRSGGRASTSDGPEIPLDSSGLFLREGDAMRKKFRLRGGYGARAARQVWDQLA